MKKHNGSAVPDHAGRQGLLRNHATMISMTVLLALFVLIMWRIASLANARMYSSMNDSLSNDAKIMDERVNGEIARLDAIGEVLAQTDDQTYDGYVKLLGKLIASSNQSYRRIGIITPDDIIYNTSGSPGALGDANEVIQDLMQLHSSAYGLLSTVYTDAQDGKNVILFAVGLPDSCSVPGMMYAVMEKDRFVEVILGDMASRTICVTDQRGYTIYASDSMQELTGGDNNESFTHALLDSSHDNFTSISWGDYTLTAAQLGFNGWLLAELTPKSDIWDGEMRAYIIALGCALIILAVLIGLTSYRMLKRARGSESLVREAGLDRLTGINNLLGFSQAARTLLMCAGSQHYALAVMNTDVQEVLGPQYGYYAGRHILEDIARTLNAECESGETCCRLDGSQFALLLRFSDTADLLLRIRALNSHLMTLCPLRVRMHYGVYVAGASDNDPSQMIEYASEAMRRVTRKGDLVGLYDDALHKKQMRDNALLNRAPAAIQGGEFEIRYIPLRDITTMDIRGAEAIALWRQPDGTMLPPSEYMPLFTRNSMTGPLNKYIIEKVFADLAKEADSGRTAGRILINLSRESLVDGMFVTHMRQTAKQYGITCRRLEILFSESILNGDDGLMANIIKQLRDEGIRICVSDFGSGSTSLRIFGDMTVDAVRLSRRFIERSSEDERGRRMLRSIGDLAASFDTDIYAAGSFTHEQLELLRKCGCARVERLHADKADNNYCLLSEIKPDPNEEKPSDPFDDWA